VSVILVTGGVRSGKSRFAEQLAARTSLPVTYVATASRNGADAEWETRIEHHRRTRPPDWDVVETAGSADCRLTAFLSGAASGRTLLVDSLGTWLADRMSSAHPQLLAEPLRLERALEEDSAALTRALERTAATTIVVGEEVGSGIVPGFASGRVFRDVLGRLQQVLGVRAAGAYLVVSGFSIDLRAVGRPLPPRIVREPGPASPRAGLEEWVRAIVPVDDAAGALARAYIDELTKPAGALGRLEEIAVQLSAISGRIPRRAYDQAVVLVAAADHGVSAEDVSAYPADVTGQMVAAFTGGYAAINALARAAGAELFVADFGIRSAPAPHPALIDVRVGPGTANLARVAAMTSDQVDSALWAGISAFNRLFERRSYDVLALGEMGIANTTSAAAIVAALTGAAPREVVGRGTGVDAAGLERKVATVNAALERFHGRDWRTVACEVGGFEIVGMAGVLLAAARRRVPVLLDGFIVAAAALLAHGIAPDAKDYWIAAHLSTERGHAAALATLGLRPLVARELRLGEATGAALALPLVEAASRMICEMKTFAEARVSTAT